MAGSKNTKPRNPKLRKIDLYLHVDEDARLLERIQNHAKSHRMNEEIRRLLYTALDTIEGQRGRSPLPAARELEPVFELPSLTLDFNTVASVSSEGSEGDQSSARAKLFMAFGKPE